MPLGHGKMGKFRGMPICRKLTVFLEALIIWQYGSGGNALDGLEWLRIAWERKRK
jgi:hypothetical protein